MNIQIRNERREDVEAIHLLTQKAFQEMAHSSLTEHYIVEALRNAGALTVSLVAQLDRAIVGHVAVSPVTISDGSSDWYGLGPISVSPNLQGRGIGTSLMKAALADLHNIEAGGCVLLGDPAYYSRFGFTPVDELRLPNVPPEYFQAILLRGSYPNGWVSYHAAFSATA